MRRVAVTVSHEFSPQLSALVFSMLKAQYQNSTQMNARDATPYERAGAALADATHIYIAAGAGASADSGMLVFSQGQFIYDFRVRKS